ncbi:MAG: fasciclin domain-containing protein, partial [Rikenellaceae bacterium]|nr:fasciclin domain-containing protein [Rikenellaceae bacterium]
MRKIVFTGIWLFFLPLLFVGCEDRFDEYYEKPEWLKGSAWDVLEDLGNYSIFLEGIELSGYKPIMEGKNLVTVMAPDDQTFSAWLSDNNYASIGAMEEQELKKLIGFHLLYYSYNKEKLINFRPEGDLATEEQKASNAGMYYKHRTRSIDAPTQGYIDTLDKYVTLYHQERFLPVFSYLYFQTKDIDAKSNYEYFYPRSTWTGGNDGFNVSNASVTEYQILADNGYIYVVDAVLEPLNTIFAELQKREDYSVFTELYDSYKTFTYDATSTNNYAAAYGVDSLYLYEHDALPNIALEWATSSYLGFTSNTSSGYSVFAPDNTAMNRFFSEYWQEGGYASLDQVEELPISYLLYQLVYSGSIVFPEELTQGKLTDVYGNVFNVNPAEVDQDARVMCVNGSLYGISRMDTPLLYASVMGPAFKYRDYLTFLYALNYSGSITTYGASNTNYIMFFPDNETMEESGYAVNTYLEGKVLEYQPEEEWVRVSSSLAQEIVRIHTIQSDQPLDPSQNQVLSTQVNFNYLYLKGGRITSSSNFNQLLNPDYTDSPFIPFTEMLNNGQAWTNGQAYVYSSDQGMFAADDSNGLKSLFGTINNARYSFYPFLELLKNAGLTSDNTIPFLLTANRFVTFVPTGDAIRAALAADQIPGITGGSFDSSGWLKYDTLNAGELGAYLMNYFLTSNDNIITTYPYIGSEFSNRTYVTAGGENLTYT